MALKHTGAELDLITDEATYLTFENFIRGEISTIFNRYAKANNPLVDDYNPLKPTSYITYLDVNSLCGAAQSEMLRVGDFHLFTPDEIFRFKIENISEYSPTGYVIECDLEYSAYLHKDQGPLRLPPCPGGSRSFLGYAF